MTEKRFTITKGFDEHERQIRDNGKIIMGCFIQPQAEPIVKLLNELHEENIRLKSENNMLRTTISRNEAYIDRLTHKSKWSNNSQELDEEYLHPSKRPMRFIG